VQLKNLQIDPYYLALIDEILDISNPYYICKTIMMAPFATSITLKLDTPYNSRFDAVSITSEVVCFNGYEGKVADPSLFKGIKALMGMIYEQEYRS